MTIQDWKAKEAARRFTAQQLQATNPHLVPAGDSLTTAAKNIRIELKLAFPGVKFSVKTSRFSGGNSIDVFWTDGPTSPQVDAIVNRYAAGSFDGMTDCYNYERNAWRDAFGDAKYIHTRREDSDRALEGAIRRVVSRFGVDPVPSVADYRAGKLWNVYVGGAGAQGHAHWSLQSQIGMAAAKHTYSITRQFTATEAA